MRVLFTKDNDSAEFLGDPAVTGLDMPPKCGCGFHSRKLCCNSAHGAGCLHGSTKLAGAGRLWTTCCSPLTSISAQSLTGKVAYG